jgi:hypothetical protein
MVHDPPDGTIAAVVLDMAGSFASATIGFAGHACTEDRRRRESRHLVT